MTIKLIFIKSIKLKEKKYKKMYKSATVRESSAQIVNKIGEKIRVNNGLLNREDILKSFSPEVLNKAWNCLCEFIAQNYESGKGTLIKGFGTFTFISSEVNLEGTTNQFQRDKKSKKPVFIVSKEFNEYLKPGQYSDSNGLIYYNQKLNNSLSHVRINYAEIAYAMGVSKEECYMIIQNQILYLSDQIRKKQFKNKEMPYLGTLLIRGNILGVKFNENIINKSKNIPQTLLRTKKDMELYMEVTPNKKVHIKDIPNVERRLQTLRPKTSVITKISHDGENWLKNNLGIDLEEIYGDENIPPQNIENNIQEEERKLNFINDQPKMPKKGKKLTLKDLNIPNDILEAIQFHKSLIIKEMKKFDKRNSGQIQKIECVRSFSKANVHYGLNTQLINEIVKIYSDNLEIIDYMKLMTFLLRDIKKIIGVNTFNETFDVQTRSFNKNNNVFKSQKLRPLSAMRLENNLNIEGNQNLNNQKVTLKQIENEIKTIKTIQESLIFNNKTRLEQKISLNEFLNILRGFDIVYPRNKINQILQFIDIENPNSFTLQEFNDKMNNCKILLSEMKTSDITEQFLKLKDIIYAAGGQRFLFKDKNSISKNEFINLFLGQTNFSEETLNAIYFFLIKSDRNFTVQDYKKYFDEDQRTMDYEFDLKVINNFKYAIEHANMKVDEYFSHLLTYNISRDSNVITRYDFHRIFLVEKYFNYSAQEIDHIFDLIDLKKDGVIDRQEFNKVIGKITRPLFEIQDIIKRYKLDIEDLAYRMDINPEKNQVLDFTGFEGKIKKLDYTLGYDFIRDLFYEMNDGKETIDTNTILKNFDVFKTQNFLELNKFSFKKNFMENIKSLTDYETLQRAFQNIDSLNNGRLTKADFCSVIQKFSNEFKDEDIMKFTRICDLVDNNNLVKYPEFLLLIYYNSKDDLFNQCIEEIKKFVKNECKNDLIIFFQKLNKQEKKSYYEVKKVTSIENFRNFLKSKIPNLTNNIVMKFDLDSDGKISIEDIKGIFERYLSTAFFKFENSSFTPDNNLYAYDTMTEEKFKSLVRQIKAEMKKKNITVVGLFNKLDTNHDGFVSNYEFNSGINNYILLSDAIKDQFFNYLDYYHNGLVDLDTFQKRFKEFKSNEIIVRNNNKLENELIDALVKWLRNNVTSLSDSEIFNLMDNDNDGIINLDDFKMFCMNNLGFSRDELNIYKLQRVMQAISLTKNNNIGLADIKELTNKAINKSDFIDLKEKFKETINQNLYKGKENTEWINEIIEKFGMFISERYESVEEFFEKNASDKNKFTFEDFEKFHRENYECFSGFNLTRDEVLAVYTTLDSQKKNYLTIYDFQNKLKMFDFYKKMHFDIKSFIQQNFNNSIDAFKFFTNQSNDDNMNKINNKTNFTFNDNFISKKNFFNTINQFFPNKYLTETILKYMRLNFKNIDNITFSEFNFIYFDSYESDESYDLKRTNKTKLSTTRQRPKSANIRGRQPKDEKLQTPYDYDCLAKLKRLINSSGFDYSSYFNMIKAKSNNGIINKYEFHNMIKDLNIGLTHLEIENIISQIGETRDGKININVFLNFINNKDKNIIQGDKNIQPFISQVKELIYKYYSNPRLAFQFNDANISNTLDFNEYKSLICDLFTREKKELPNFTLLKNSFDYLDLRKDGEIDMNEWLRSFGNISSNLDINGNKKKINQLKKWEVSNDLQKIYVEISRNRKLIKDNVKPFLINDGSGSNVIQCDNLISVLQSFLPRTNISRTQWKMLVKIGDKDRSGMIDFDLFMNMVEKSARSMNEQPRFK